MLHHMRQVLLTCFLIQIHPLNKSQSTPLTVAAHLSLAFLHLGLSIKGAGGLGTDYSDGNSSQLQTSLNYLQSKTNSVNKLC